MDALLVHINKLYGLELLSYEKVVRGFLSENHVLIQKDKKFFLKRYRFEEKDRIEEIHLSKKYFAKGGVPVILPLTNRNQETFFFFDGGYFALFPFVHGRQLERGSLTNAAAKSLGEMLGKIHLLGKEARLPIKERFKPWNKKKILEKISTIELQIKKIKNLNNFDRLALKNVELKKNLVLANSTTYEDLDLPSNHLIHSDYLEQNVFFDDSDNVSHVFDFEKTDYSPRMYELFRSIMYSFFHKDFSEGNFKKAKLFLNSYLKVYPTSKNELKKGLKLFYLKSIHAAWVEGEHYLKGNTRVDDFLEQDFYRINYLSKHFQEFEGKML